MNYVTVLGYMASLLTFSSFYLKTIVKLRLAAIASNICFITYATYTHLTPIIWLHGLMLPLNVWRLLQVHQLTRQVRQASKASSLNAELLVPHMKIIHKKKGQTLFSSGSLADCVYYVLKGQVQLNDKPIILKPGDIIGIIGVFTKERLRTDTAICHTDVELGMIANDKVLELFHLHPSLGTFVMRMMAQRNQSPSKSIYKALPGSLVQNLPIITSA